MSYLDAEPTTEEGKLGKHIYMEALAARRGFRDDQLGISDPDIWGEIFEDVGRAAIAGRALLAETDNA